MDSSENYSIEIANQDDIEGLSKMLYKTEDDPEYEWGMGTEEERLVILRRLMMHEGNRFFYKNFKVLKRNEKTIGFFLAFGGKELKVKTIKSDMIMYSYREGKKNKIKFLIEILKYLFYKECTLNEYYLSNIYIEEEYRGLGYSYILLEAVLSEAICRKYNKLSLRANNHKLVEFYRKFGYKLENRSDLKMVLKI
ncbi:MAG: GNAT family N-acetyltransferase [Clostridium sp.]|uniref:GNAT family N-acetyltransferase n=1 Tax=Clostridium sp. TaxID=1506 RepID=UPI003F39F15C